MAIKVEPVASEKRTVARLDIEGELDAMGSPLLEQAVSKALLNAEIKTLIFNLSEMNFVSSAGLRIIAKVRNLMKQRNGLMLLVNPQPQVNKVFTIVKSVQLSDIYANDADLDAYLTTVQRV